MKIPTFKAPSFKAPSFAKKPLPSMAKAPDPLKGVSLPDDIEESPRVELDAVQQGFRERAQQEAQRFEDATDTGYYTCVVFENRAQLDAFLTGIGMLNQGDLYLDGREMAAKLGIAIPAADRRGGSAAKIDPKLAALSR